MTYVLSARYRRSLLPPKLPKTPKPAAKKSTVSARLSMLIDECAHLPDDLERAVLLRDQAAVDAALGAMGKAATRLRRLAVQCTGDTAAIAQADRFKELAKAARKALHGLPAAPGRLLLPTLPDPLPVLPVLQVAPVASHLADPSAIDDARTHTGQQLSDYAVGKATLARQGAQFLAEYMRDKREAQNTYAQTPGAKAARKAYTQSPEAKAARKAYAQSEKGKAARKATQKAYAQSAKGKAAQYAANARYLAKKKCRKGVDNL